MPLIPKTPSKVRQNRVVDDKDRIGSYLHTCKCGIIFTARVRSTREDNIYTWECLSVHIAGGGEGYPIPGLASRGATPSQVWLGGTSSQAWEGRGTLLTRSGQGTPGPGMGYPLDLEKGTPPDLGWGTPRPEMGYPPQHSEHLIRGGRYASCVHAGGLSCLWKIFFLWKSTNLF